MRSGRTRLALAALAAALVFVVSRFAITWFTARYACPDPGSWWPGWATLCADDPATVAAQSLMRADWGGALPAMLAAGAFLLVGLPRGR